MDDFLEAARSGINGTVADFSNWKGIKEGEYKHMGMKINSSEKVIEPIEEGEFNEQANVQEVVKPSVELPPQPQFRDDVSSKQEPQVEEQEIHNMPDRPGKTQAYLNPVEMKNIAVKLMPTVDKLMPNIYEPVDRAAMRNVSEAAINLAFEFLKVWNEKVVVE